jgi:SAM-dependent methyltransferase
MSRGLASSCIVCGSEDLVELVRLPSVPALCNQLLCSYDEARQAARAAIELVGCRVCGHMFNAGFDPARVTYSTAYENSLHGSPRYRQYTEAIIDRLLAAYGLEGGRVVEIGCGRGEFLRRLCERGMRKAVGFDPGRADATITVSGAELVIIGAGFDGALAPPADAVCSRHVLEHLPQPVELLRAIRAAYGPIPPRVVFVEVPNGGFTLDRLGVWDLIYEHVSYFTASSLSRALMLAGLVPDRVETAFGGQFLIAEAQFGQQRNEVAAGPSATVAADAFGAFGAQFAATVEAWGAWLDAARRDGRQLTLWGGGSKGITFLNLLDQDGKRAIARVVDSNPLKAGTFVAGTGHPVVPPWVLREHPPQTILLMNSQYEMEVRQTLQDLDIAPELVTVSGRMPPMMRAAE